LITYSIYYCDGTAKQGHACRWYTLC